MALMKAASCILHIAVLLCLTDGSPFINVGPGTNNQGSSGKNAGSKNVINPILPAKAQQPISQVSTTKKPKKTKTPEVSRPTATAGPTTRTDGSQPTRITPKQKASQENPENWIRRRNPEGVYMSHPCNAVHNFRTQDFEATARKAGRNRRIKCHRLSEGELLSQRNCSGIYKESFTAMSFEQAVKNAQERTQPKKRRRKGRRQRKQNRKPKKARAKRDVSRSAMTPGTWEVCNCLARNSVDPDTGLGMPCGTCSTIYMQNTTSRFPQYVNGVICHPNEDELVYAQGNPIGRCVQQSFSQDLLEWKGQWVKDVVQSQQLGIDVYVEKWDEYTQIIKSSCVFQFFVT